MAGPRDVCFASSLKGVLQKKTVGFWRVAMGQNLFGTFLGMVTTLVFFKGFLGGSPGYRGFDPLPYCFNEKIHVFLFLGGEVKHKILDHDPCSTYFFKGEIPQTFDYREFERYQTGNDLH